jgi:hypothetical protein
VEVMIFIVDPGGCTSDQAMPAAARMAPVWGLSTAIPAY